MTFALVPPGTIGTVRYVAITVAVVGFLGELGWVFAGWLLVGSPGTAYNTQPDEPRSDVRASRLRRSPPLRRVARLFVPLVRIDVDGSSAKPGEEAQGDIVADQQQTGSHDASRR